MLPVITDHLRLLTTPEEEKYLELWAACRSYETQKIDALLEEGVSPECESWQNKTRLSCLSTIISSEEWPNTEERTYYFRTLVEKGANPKFVWPDGSTLLYKALMANSPDLLTFLIKEYGLDVNARTTDNSTLLHLAARRKDSTLLEILLQHGANPLAEDKRNKKPSDVAISEAGRQLLLAAEQQKPVLADKSHKPQVLEPTSSELPTPLFFKPAPSSGLRYRGKSAPKEEEEEEKIPLLNSAMSPRE